MNVLITLSTGGTSVARKITRIFERNAHTGFGSVELVFEDHKGTQTTVQPSSVFKIEIAGEMFR